MIAHEKAAGMLDTSEAAQETTQQADSRPDKQRLATLRARAEVAGVQFVVFPDEDTGATVYIVSRWNLTRQLESIDAAEKWLDMVCGVKHG